MTAAPLKSIFGVWPYAARRWSVGFVERGRSPMLPDAVHPFAPTTLAHVVERLHFVGCQAPAERAGVLFGLRLVLGARDRDRSFANDPVQCHLRRRLAAV